MSSIFSIFYLGLVGFLAGLTTNKIMHFRNYQNILKVIAINALATLIYYSSNYSLVTILIINSIFLALLMVIFAKTVSRDQPISSDTVKPVLPPSEEVKSINVQFLSWWKRMLIGAATGMILGIIGSIINSSSFPLGLATLYFSITCGIAGLVIYPRKASMFLLLLGFIIAGVILSSSETSLFIIFGIIFGLPGGALLSRILYWVKVIK